MKKALIVISSLMLITGVFSAQSLAHGGARGGHGWHGGNGHGAKHAQIYRATLLPVTGGTGATGETGQTGATQGVASAKHGHKHHSRHHRGKHASVTGPYGRAQWVQNANNYRLDVKVKNLTASSTYSVKVYENTDGQGCASTTNTALTAPVIPDITTSSTGLGKTRVKGMTSDAGLDPTKSYYLSVTDSTGAVVLCGELKLKGRHGHGHGGCGSHGGGSTGETGETGDTGSTGGDGGQNG